MLALAAERGVLRRPASADFYDLRNHLTVLEMK